MTVSTKTEPDATSMAAEEADFAKLVELFDAHGVSFISVTQAFNTTSSMGRLTLNMLLSFAQFECEMKPLVPWHTLFFRRSLGRRRA